LGSSLEAVSVAARAIKSGEASLVIAGGVESMSRAPFVMAKSKLHFPVPQIGRHDHRLAVRESAMKEKYGTDSMPETAENVAEQWKISREDQDAFALRSQQRAAAAMKDGRLRGNRSGDNSRKEESHRGFRR